MKAPTPEDILHMVKRGHLRPRDLDQEWRLILAGMPSLTREIVEDLLADKSSVEKDNQKLYRLIATNPAIPLDWYLDTYLADKAASCLTDVPHTLSKQDFVAIYSAMIWPAPRAKFLTRNDVPLDWAKQEIEHGRNTDTHKALIENADVRNALAASFVKCETREVWWTLARLTTDPEILHQLLLKGNLPLTEICLTREMLPEEDLRAVFASGDYRKSLAENTNLPPDLTEALYASEDRATQDLCLRCGNFPKETLERLITSPSTRIRRSLFVNPHLTAEQRLFLCIEKPIIISTARNSYLPFENDRTSRISPEAQFVLRGGAGWLEYYTPGVLAGNAALAEELKNWPETMTGKLPYRWSPDLKRGIPSPLSLRDIPSLPFVGWWEPGSPTWTILVKTKATQWDTLTATLPDHADAWLRMVHSGSHLLVGMIPEPSGFFLWGAPTSPTSAKISVPPLKSKYQIPRKMRREPIEADLRGCAMLQGGLYALWQEGPSLIGWTQERELGKIPAHRILMEEDLVNNQSLDLRLPEFKEAVRSARGHQLAL